MISTANLPFLDSFCHVQSGPEDEHLPWRNVYHLIGLWIPRFPRIALLDSEHPEIPQFQIAFLQYEFEHCFERGLDDLFHLDLRIAQLIRDYSCDVLLCHINPLIMGNNNRTIYHKTIAEGKDKFHKKTRSATNRPGVDLGIGMAIFARRP
jgi:hypothetical protein